MKKFKKIMAVLVAAIMVVAMTVPAWADVNVTISQEDAPYPEGVGAETYYMYKIFDVTKTETGKGNTSNTTVNKVTDNNYESVGTISSTNDWDTKSNNDEYPLYLRGVDGKFTKVDAYSDDYQGREFFKLKTYPGLVYTIASNSPWKTVLESAENVWVTMTPTTASDGRLLVEWKNDDHSVAQTRDFAKWLYKNKGSIATNKTMTTTPANKIATETIDEGYWLIASTLGTELVLATTDINIKTKNSYPTTLKKASDNDYYVGDYVEYKITVDLPASLDYTKPVIIHDTMSSNLKLVTTKHTTEGDYGWSAVSGATALTAADAFSSHVDLWEEADFATNYAARTADPKTHDSAHTHTEGDGFQIFDFILDVSSLKADANTEQGAKAVVITYYAELLGEAALRTNIPNSEYVEYSKYSTNESTDNVQTYGFDVLKTFENSATSSGISATFELKPVTFAQNASGTYYKKGGEYTLTAPASNLITQEQIENADYEFDTVANGAKKYAMTEGSAISFEISGSTYTKQDTNTVSTPSTTITASDDVVTSLKGLDEGFYTLTEIGTANGYKPLTSPVVIKIANGGTPTVVSGPDECGAFDNYQLPIENKTSTALPATGGMGTTVLYIVGGMLVILAGAYLFFSRKRTA